MSDNEIAQKLDLSLLSNTLRQEVLSFARMHLPNLRNQEYTRSDPVRKDPRLSALCRSNPYEQATPRQPRSVRRAHPD